jgi:hypothetical protein
MENEFHVFLVAVAMGAVLCVPVVVGLIAAFREH